MVNFHLGLLFFFVLSSVFVFLVSGFSRNLPILSFDEGYTQLFGDDNLMVLEEGKFVHISLNERTGLFFFFSDFCLWFFFKKSFLFHVLIFLGVFFLNFSWRWLSIGSGFVSHDLYLHGFFSASIKLPSDYTAGVVVAFYVSQNCLMFPSFFFLLLIWHKITWKWKKKVFISHFIALVSAWLFPMILCLSFSLCNSVLCFFGWQLPLSHFLHAISQKSSFLSSHSLMNIGNYFAYFLVMMVLDYQEHHPTSGGSKSFLVLCLSFDFLISPLANCHSKHFFFSLWEFLFWNKKETVDIDQYFGSSFF